MGKDDNDQDLFCFESNDIESFTNIIKFGSGLSIDYWISKHWFVSICNYNNGMLIHKYDLNDRLGEYRTEYHEGEIRYYGNSRTEQDKLVILSLRENLSDKYYDYNSTKPEDDYKICVPRRVAKFQSKSLAIKIEMLFKLLQKPKRHMFQDDKYILKISYDSSFLADGDDKNKLVMHHSYKDLAGKDKEVCKLLESFIKYYYNHIYHSLSNEIKENLESQLSDTNVKMTSIGEYKNYYFNIIKILSEDFFNDEDDTRHVLNSYMALAEELSKNKNIKFVNNYISFDITKKAPFESIKR